MKGLRRWFSSTDFACRHDYGLWLYAPLNRGYKCKTFIVDYLNKKASAQKQ